MSSSSLPLPRSQSAVQFIGIAGNVSPVINFSHPPRERSLEWLAMTMQIEELWNADGTPTPRLHCLVTWMCAVPTPGRAVLDWCNDSFPICWSTHQSNSGSQKLDFISRDRKILPFFVQFRPNQRQLHVLNRLSMAHKETFSARTRRCAHIVGYACYMLCKWSM